MRPSSLSIVVPSFNVGGAEVVAVKLANAFAEFGWTVAVLAMTRSGPLEADLDPRVSVVDLNSSTLRSAVVALARHYNQTRPDAVLTTLYGTGLAALAARLVARHRPAIAVGAHNSLRAKSARPDNWKDRYILLPLARFLFPKGDAVIAVSKGVAEEIAQLIRIDPRKLHAIYNPVVTPAFLKRARESVSHPWLGPKSERRVPTIISAGRMVGQKGLDTLLSAFALVRRQADCHLILIGDGPVRRTMEGLSLSLGIADSVDFVGFQTNPQKFVAQANLFVLSSRWEGLANTVIEALAVGCPVVATDCTFGPREILEDGIYGLLTPVDKPETLARAILSALSSPDSPRNSRQALMKRGHQFSLDSAASRYREVFVDIIAKRRVARAEK